MRLPHVGERWIVMPCKAHVNSPGAYVWQPPPIFDGSLQRQTERIKCGCFFPEVECGVEAEKVSEEARV